MGRCYKDIKWLCNTWIYLSVYGSIFSCQEFYIGKTEEELYREMFEVDSLISKIQFMIDSLEVDGTKVWQDH